MAEERNNGGGGRTAATAGIIALLLLLGGGGYFGLGPGQGMLPGNGDSVQQEQSESQGEAKEAAAQTEQDQKEEAVSEIPDNIIVTIKKDVVTINGHEVADSEELKKYVEEYNSDSRTFTLEEEESILDTYNWVKAVFDELDIQTVYRLINGDLWNDRTLCPQYTASFGGDRSMQGSAGYIGDRILSAGHKAEAGAFRHAQGVDPVDHFRYSDGIQLDPSF